MKKYKNIFNIKSLFLIFSVFFILVIFCILGFSVNIFNAFSNQTDISLSKCVQKQVCTDCNLILISVDSLRTDHVGAYGYKRNTTPNFDRLAHKSALFTQHITPSYITTVTEAAVHTGLHPIANGVTHFESVLPVETQTLAQTLKKYQYTNVALHTSPEYLKEQGVKETFNRGFDWYQMSGGYRDFSEASSAKIIQELEFLKKTSKFFYWITAGGVHIPFGKDAKTWFGDTQYDDFFDPRILNWTTISRMYDGMVYDSSGSYELTSSQKKRIIDMYDSGIRQFDEFLGKFIQKLTTLGLMDNTVIVIYSQHGEDLGEHKTYFHSDIYDVQIHTPLLIYAPQINQKTVSTMVSSIDIYPTIFSFLGIPHPVYSQAKNLVPYICDEHALPQSPVFSQRVPLWEQIVGIRNNEVTGETLIPHTLPPNSYDVAVRTNQWKYILRLSKPILDEFSWWKQNNVKQLYPIPEDELYDIQKDPYEQENIVTDHPDIQKQFNTTIMNWFDVTLKKNPKGIEKAPRLQEYF